MLSFKHFLLEYDFDPFVRGMSPTEMGYANKNKPVRPSISKSIGNADMTMLRTLSRLKAEGKLSQIGYTPADSLPYPSEMSQGDLELLRSHADKHLGGFEKLEFNQAAHVLVATDPMANIELQNLGGASGTDQKGWSSAESRRGGAGHNLMIARSQQRRSNP